MKKKGFSFSFLAIIFLVVLILIIACVLTIKNNDRIKEDESTCFDENLNNICNNDETEINETAEFENNISIPVSGINFCGDGICSSEEAKCIFGNYYEKNCSEDCKGICGAYLDLSESALEGDNDNFTYYCKGYKNEVCTKTGANKFSITNLPSYESGIRGIATTVRNIGDYEAQDISASFECYKKFEEEEELILSSDGTYKGIDIESYFSDGEEKKQILKKLYSAKPIGNNIWNYEYYLSFNDLEKLEEGYVLNCDVKISSKNPKWKEIQKLEISLLKSY